MLLTFWCPNGAWIFCDNIKRYEQLYGNIILCEGTSTLYFTDSGTAENLLAVFLPSQITPELVGDNLSVLEVWGDVGH